MVKKVIARIGICATALALPAVGLVGVQSASAVNSCKSDIQLAVSTYQQVQVAKQAWSNRSQQIAASKTKEKQQLANIAQLQIPSKWKSRAVTATKIEFGALEGWYDADFGATTVTAGLVADYVYTGNKTQCPTAADSVTAADYIATAQTAVQTNLTTWQNTAETMIPQFVKTITKAAKKFNHSEIGWRSVKKLIGEVKDAGAKLITQAKGLTQIKAQDEAVTSQLNTQLTTSPFAPQP